MQTRRLQAFAGLLLILLLLAGCSSPTYTEIEAETPAAEATATPVQVTLAAPAPADPALVAEIGIDPAQLSLNTQGLPLPWRANAVAGTPYTAGSGGATGLPAHIQVNFGSLDPALRQPTDPVLYVIPVDAWRTLWGDAGDDMLDLTLLSIFNRSVALPNPPPLRNLPALPNEVTGAGLQDFATQVGEPATNPGSASRNGFRFVGRFVDESAPVTNEEMQYVYQGFTNDGEYLVAVFFPGVTNPALPASRTDITDAQMTEFNNGQDAALAASAVALSEEPSSAWTPDVALLDALVASLSIPGVPANALAGTAWSLVEMNEAGDTIAHDGSAAYQISFNPGGALTFVADCNVGAGQYVVAGGFAGSIAIEMGPSTLVACPEESIADMFLAALSNVQQFALGVSGDELILETINGGQTLTFAPLGAPDEEVPVVEPPVVEIPTPEPALPMGTVIGAQGANIRSGPGTNFSIIGFAPAGTTALITGRNAAGDWFVVSIPSLPGGVGWISAPLLAATNVQDLPIIASPPTPVPTATPVAPTPTPTPIPPTPIPSASINFSADRTNINQGECVTLRWDVQNVTAVWVYPLGANFRDFPVAGQGSRQECPNVTTTYEMRVQLINGQLELRQVTINVRAANPLAGTNWMVSQLMEGQIPLGDNTLTLSLGADGRFSGFGGCNTVNGTYTVEGSSINFRLGAGTMIACDENTNWIQDSFQNTLSNTAFYEFLGFQLVFRSFGGVEQMRLLAN